MSVILHTVIFYKFDENGHLFDTIKSKKGIAIFISFITLNLFLRTFHFISSKFLMSELSLNPSYAALISEIKQKIQSSQIRAVTRFNQELISLYWEIGTLILDRQKKEGWGSKVVDQLSIDLKLEFPAMKGFSKRNLLYMRQFAVTYSDMAIVQQAVAQIGWGHNVDLMLLCKTEVERQWYAHQAIENGWSRNMLTMHIESKLYERQGKAITNFTSTLPEPASDMARQMMKDPYIFDFVTLEKKAIEKDLEEQLVKHITNFLLELGTGFAFVGRQYIIPVDGDDHRIDLLFYHLKLRCYVAIDLKMRKFDPGDAGKMNFYLSAIDAQVKDPLDAPSIGIILCKDKKGVKAEYALKDINKPIGISEFRLIEAIPDDLKSSLPTIEELERELKDPE